MVRLPGISVVQDDLKQFTGQEQGEVVTSIDGQLSFWHMLGRRATDKGCRGIAICFLEVEAQQRESHQSEVDQRISYTLAWRNMRRSSTEQWRHGTILARHARPKSCL